jgi:hypothetical protein
MKEGCEGRKEGYKGKKYCEGRKIMKEGRL